MKTAANYRVGENVFVLADQGVRRGTVTGIGRTRIKVRHPKNIQGDMAERAYPMSKIVEGLTRTKTAYGDKTEVRFENGDSTFGQWYVRAAEKVGVPWV